MDGRSSKESVLSIATEAKGTSMQGLTRRGVFPGKMWILISSINLLIKINKNMMSNIT